MKRTKSIVYEKSLTKLLLVLLREGRGEVFGQYRVLVVQGPWGSMLAVAGYVNVFFFSLQVVLLNKPN